MVFSIRSLRLDRMLRVKKRPVVTRGWGPDIVCLHRDSWRKCWGKWFCILIVGVVVCYNYALVKTPQTRVPPPQNQFFICKHF